MSLRKRSRHQAAGIAKKNGKKNSMELVKKRIKMHEMVNQFSNSHLGLIKHEHNIWLQSCLYVAIATIIQKR